MVEAYFTEQHELIRKLAHDFAEKELTKEVLDQVEETEEFPEEILDTLGLRFPGSWEARERTPGPMFW